MIPFIVSAIGGYLIGDALKTEKFQLGGQAGAKYVIENADGQYFSLDMSGNPIWGSMGTSYTYAHEEAMNNLKRLESMGYQGLRLVPYDKDYWKKPKTLIDNETYQQFREVLERRGKTLFHLYDKPVDKWDAEDVLMAKDIIKRFS